MDNQNEQPLPEAQRERRKWSTRKKLLVAIGVLLGISCLFCGIGAVWLFQWGKPIPPLQFVDGDTMGIAVLRADSANEGYRQVIAYMAESALRHELTTEKEHISALTKLQEPQNVQIGAFTAVASYRGHSPENLRVFFSLTFAELPRIGRMLVQRVFDAGAADTPRYRGAAIRPARSVMEGWTASGVKLPKDKQNWVEDLMVGAAHSCVFAGREADGVKAGLDAFAGAEPPADSPFMQVYRRADSTRFIHGALLNEDDVLLAAFLPLEQIPQVRADMASELMLDPHHVKNIAFSLELLSNDEAVLDLSIEGANAEAVKQIDAALRAVVRSTQPGAKEFTLIDFQELDIPLTLTLQEARSEGLIHFSTIKVAGLKALIDACIGKLAEAQRESGSQTRQMQAVEDVPSDLD